MQQDDDPRPPQRLRSLVSWQCGKVSTVATRLTAARMPLTARADYAVLAALEEDGSLSQVGLVRRLGLDRGDVSGVVDRLHADGHVDRRADPTDRRRNTVTLTHAGHRRLEEIQNAADGVQRDLLVALDDDEVRHLGRLLDRVLSAHPVPPA